MFTGQKKYFLQTSGDKVAGIIIIPDQHDPQKYEGKKYSHIDNTQRGVFTFILFAKRRFKAATCVNFYCKKTGSFIGKILLE